MLNWAAGAWPDSTRVLRSGRVGLLGALPGSWALGGTWGRLCSSGAPHCCGWLGALSDPLEFQPQLWIAWGFQKPVLNAEMVD